MRWSKSSGRTGFSFERMREVVRFLKKKFRRPLAENVSGSSNYHLITDGRALYGETLRYAIVGLLKNSRQPMFAICLSDAVRQVKALVGGGKRPGRGRPEKARSMREAKSS